MALETGRVMVRRQYQRDDLLSRLWVGTVVADDERGLAIWVASGSAYRDIGALDGRAFREVPFGEWGRTEKSLHQKVWRGDMLMLHPRGEASSVWFFFEPDGTFRQWYVNLEEPGSSWDDGQLAGIDTVDQDLDVVVGPDRTWRWKDEEEFAHHLAYPDVYWVDDPESVWAEGKRVIKVVESGQFPFDGSFTNFRPDPSWTVPAAVPAGFERPRVRP